MGVRTVAGVDLRVAFLGGGVDLARAELLSVAFPRVPSLERDGPGEAGWRVAVR